MRTRNRRLAFVPAGILLASFGCGGLTDLDTSLGTVEPLDGGDTDGGEHTASGQIDPGRIETGEGETDASNPEPGRTDSGTTTKPDAGSADTGAPPRDAGTPIHADSGNVDAETPNVHDAGAFDAGTPVGPDSGIVDAGHPTPVDAGRDAGPPNVPDGGRRDGGSNVPDAGRPDSGPPTPTDAGRPDSGPPPAPDAGVKTVSLKGVFQDIRTQMALAGVSVCVAEQPAIPCVQTNAEGAFELPRIPANADALIKVSRSGYLTAYFPLTFGTETFELPRYFLIDTSAAGLLANFTGTTVSNSVGGVAGTVVDASETPVEGVTIAYAPTSGVRWYFSTSNLPDTSLTKTSTIGAFGGGNLTPGNVTVTATHASLKCSSAPHWSRTPAGGTKLRIVGGAITYTRFLCAP